MGGAGERTETATPKRRNEARKRGQVAKSADLASVTVLLGALLGLRAFGVGSAHVVRTYFVEALTHLDDTRISPQLLEQHVVTMGLVLFHAIGPLLALSAVLGIAANWVQTGPVWATERLRLNLQALNPLNGMSRLFNPNSLVNLVKSIYKMAVIGYVAIVTMQASYPQLVMAARFDLGEAAGLVAETAYRMALRVAAAMLVMSALDYFYQRYSHEKSLRMTKDEVKQEMKNADGDPRIKARIRARQRQIARKRMMDAVPMADVVITNPTHYAVALKYSADENEAPVVVAKGADFLALRIREIAQMADVPIVENPPLARALYRLVDVDREIPSDLYAAVAEVLAFVYQIDRRRRSPYTQRKAYA
jgi:flagellar biosynthetic protein FlhB